jgi:hypothetical protein
MHKYLYLTLHPIPSDFLTYEDKFIFFFINVQSMTKKGTQNVDIKKKKTRTLHIKKQNKRDCPFGNFLHWYCPLTLLYGRAVKVTLPYQHHCTLYKVELTFCKGKALHLLEGPERIWFSISPPSTHTPIRTE